MSLLLRYLFLLRLMPLGTPLLRLPGPARGLLRTRPVSLDDDQQRDQEKHEGRKAHGDPQAGFTSNRKGCGEAAEHQARSPQGPEGLFNLAEGVSHSNPTCPQKVRRQ